MQWIFFKNFWVNFKTFLNRFKRRFNFKIVKDFVKSSEQELFITETINEKCIRNLKELELFRTKFDTVSYRLVKVFLPSGETEVLMTNKAYAKRGRVYFAFYFDEKQ